MYICAADSFWGAQGGDPDYPVEPGALYSGSVVARVQGARRGVFAVIDVKTNRLAWRQQWPDQCYSGSIVTAGGLVFIGRNDGRLTALDKSNGKKLWEFQTDGGVNAPASTFEYKGKQYVVVHAGGTALGGQQAKRRRVALLARRHHALDAARISRSRRPIPAAHRSTRSAGTAAARSCAAARPARHGSAAGRCGRSCEGKGCVYRDLRHVPRRDRQGRTARRRRVQRKSHDAVDHRCRDEGPRADAALRLALFTAAAAGSRGLRAAAETEGVRLPPHCFFASTSST